MARVARRVVLGVRQQHRVPGLPSVVSAPSTISASSGFGCRRRRSRCARGTAAEALGQQVRLVAELVDRLHDARRASRGLTSGCPETTRETEEIETHARSATSRIAARAGRAAAVRRAPGALAQARRPGGSRCSPGRAPSRGPGASDSSSQPSRERRPVGDQVPPDRVAVGVEALDDRCRAGSSASRCAATCGSSWWPICDVEGVAPSRRPAATPSGRPTRRRRSCRRRSRPRPSGRGSRRPRTRSGPAQTGMPAVSAHVAHRAPVVVPAARLLEPAQVAGPRRAARTRSPRRGVQPWLASAARTKSSPAGLAGGAEALRVLLRRRGRRP